MIDLLATKRVAVAAVFRLPRGVNHSQKCYNLIWIQLLALHEFVVTLVTPVCKANPARYVSGTCSYFIGLTL